MYCVRNRAHLAGQNQTRSAPHADRVFRLQPWEAVIARASERAADLAPIVTELRAAGVTSLRGIAAALNERGIPTATRQGVWGATQVRRMLAQLAA
jgi:hypothetical protein